MGNRYTSVLHAHFKNNCSSLNNEHFRNHVRDIPLCDLRGVDEDTTHYFFHCRKYLDLRQAFNDIINAILDGQGFAEHQSD